ncbi:MAG: hypothetical protein IPP90_00635 [Gemmatimonadaceae bacterium]|nr:hypothetical protein [Gemmatimonadaceae bacterium]
MRKERTRASIRVAIAAAICAIAINAAHAADAPKHHLVYDGIDKLFYCLGTPVDCDFGEE